MLKDGSARRGLHSIEKDELQLPNLTADDLVDLA